ncbi:exosome complex component RRP41 [Silurus asotus]|nr:exosome complex component RRP41 [Silurus asotus]
MPIRTRVPVYREGKSDRMAGLELLSDQGYRLDGRKATELRKLQARMGVFGQADGSAYLEQGNTKALAVVYGPHEVRGSRSKSLHDRAVINCQYSMATFSTAERKRRPHGDRKSSEMSLHLKQTFEAAVLTQLYPRSQIDIYVKILQSDGGNYSACVNAATLALVDAGIPMRDYVCACTAGFVEDTPLADLCHAEESGGGTTLSLALLPRRENIALVQMDARLHQDHLPALMEAATVACKGLSKVLDSVVRQHLQEVSVQTREMSSITRFWSKVRKKYRCENVPPSEPGPSTESSSVLLDKEDTNSNPSEDSTKILEVTSPKPKKKYTQTQYEENTKSTKTTSEEETKCLTPTITAEELCTPVGCFVNLWKLRYSAGSQLVLTKDLLLLSLINEVTAVNPNFSISEPNNGITFICQCLEQIIETVRILGWKDDSDPRCPVGSNFDIKIKKVIKCSRCAFQQNILHECNIITVPLEYKSVDQCLYNICNVRHGVVDCYTHRPPQWWTCNDELISLTTEEDVLQKSLSNAYLLLYERVFDSVPDKGYSGQE